jgi:hypothetical protein
MKNEFINLRTNNQGFQNMKANDRTCPVHRRHTGAASLNSKLVSGLRILMASLALAAAAGPARATTQTAVPNSPAAIGAPSAINSSATPVGTQRLERPDQVPNGIAAPDWARIWPQLEADEYAIRPASKSSGSVQYEAWNPQEQLHAEFATEGLCVARRAEAGQAGPCARLVLKRYGYGQQLQEALPPDLVASGNRIEYRRGTLTEW